MACWSSKAMPGCAAASRSRAATSRSAARSAAFAAVIYVRGGIAWLGADARVEPLTDADVSALADLLAAAGLDHDPLAFKRVASAKSLYHWNADADQDY